MTLNLVIVGCGNVGSRHLQAVAKLPFPIQIHIVEPSKDAQTIAKSRLNEIQHDSTNKTFFWHESINELKTSDLTIVATTAVGRAKLLSDLLELGHSRFLIEKMVCQSVVEYNLLISKFKEKNAKGWVNTNPRCFEAYRKIKDYFSGSVLIHLSVIASNASALGTNAIHYIDLFSFLVNDYKIKLNGEFLLNELFPNKLGPHLVEFAGTITGAVKNGSSMALTFIPNTSLPVIVNIAGKDKHLMIDETNEKIFDLTYRNDHNIQYKYEHTSSLTTKIVQDILEKDDCNLSTISDLYHPHCELFRMFNAHVKKITGKELELCPIT